MEQAINVLIIIHATFGGISLLAGLVAMIAKKGRTVHKKSGLVFFYAMVATGVSAFIIAVLPKHENPFLFAVGLFSLYFVLSGYRALGFKKKNFSLKIDTFISISMLVIGICMIFLPIIVHKNINSVLLVFGLVGITFASKDLIAFKHPEKLKKDWLKMHLGKMIGGYISATTAFVIVNGFFPGISGWFIPGIIGGVIIVYWIQKINKNT